MIMSMTHDIVPIQNYEKYDIDVDSLSLLESERAIFRPRIHHCAYPVKRISVWFGGISVLALAAA